MEGGGSEPSDTWELLLGQSHGHPKSRFQVLVNLHLLWRSQEWVPFPTRPAEVTTPPVMGESVAGQGFKGSRQVNFCPHTWARPAHRTAFLQSDCHRHWSKMNALGLAELEVKCHEQTKSNFLHFGGCATCWP